MGLNFVSITRPTNLDYLNLKTYGWPKAYKFSRFEYSGSKKPDCFDLSEDGTQLNTMIIGMANLNVPIQPTDDEVKTLLESIRPVRSIDYYSVAWNFFTALGISVALGMVVEFFIRH